MSNTFYHLLLLLIGGILIDIYIVKGFYKEELLLAGKFISLSQYYTYSVNFSGFSLR